jgi:uncharacterized protein (TIGR01777 family)
MVSVCIAGSTGFIGNNLVQRLQQEGYNVSGIARGDYENGVVLDKIRNSSIVINLAGESIAGFWTRKKKLKIYNSRVLTTRKLVSAINLAGDAVKLVIQVSGVGIYDNLQIHSEESKDFDKGFLSQVINDWEGELSGLKNDGLRVVVLRLGIVLDKEGGILKQMLLPLKSGVGFGIRSEEYFPFVHLDDLMNVFIFCIKNPAIEGVVNVVAPALTKINHFFKSLMKAKNIRIVLWFNTGVIRLLLGESGRLLTCGQNVIPEKLLKDGFIFRYNNIEDALRRACN